MKKFFLIFSLFLCFCLTVSARMINVEGYGRTLKEAERDGVRNAVERAVGTVVSSDSFSSNGQIISDNILTHSQGYVNDYQIVDKQKTNMGWKVLLQADVDVNANSKLLSDLARLGLIDAALRNPKIGVLMFVDRWQERGDSNPAEMAFINRLTEAGFTQVVDVNKGGRYNYSDYLYDASELKRISAANKTDILIVGRVTHSRVGDVAKNMGNGYGQSGVISYRAQVDAKMYMAKTDRIVAADTKVASGVDIAERTAAGIAVKNVSRNMADYMIEKLLQSGSGQRQYVEVIVQANDFSKLNLVKKALEESEQVKGVQVTSYSGGQGTLTVHFAGSAQGLYEIISKKAECNIALVNFAYDSLSIRAY